MTNEANGSDQLLIHAGCVLPVASATELLPGAPDDVRTWLEEKGLVFDFLGTPVVIWGDVLATLRGADRPKPTIPAGSVVSEDRAARALPWRRGDAVAWLREQGLSVPAAGRRVVVWDAVLERLRFPPQRAQRKARSEAPKPLAKPGRIFG